MFAAAAAAAAVAADAADAVDGWLQGRGGRAGSGQGVTLGGQGEGWTWRGGGLPPHQGAGEHERGSPNRCCYHPSWWGEEEEEEEGGPQWLTCLADLRVAQQHKAMHDNNTRQHPPQHTLFVQSFWSKGR